MKNNQNVSLSLGKNFCQKIKSEKIFIQNNSLALEEKDVRTEIIRNYSEIEKATRKILNYCIENDICTPTAYHNLFFYIEICLKLKLLFSSNLPINKLEKFRHTFLEITNYLQQKTSINFDGFYHILRKIKNKNGKSIDYNKHHNFKYNKELGCDDLIFNLKLNDEDKNIIREVIKWLDLHI